jgi:hypothetical protein
MASGTADVEIGAAVGATVEAGGTVVGGALELAGADDVVADCAGGVTTSPAGASALADGSDGSEHAAVTSAIVKIVKKTPDFAIILR